MVQANDAMERALKIRGGGGDAREADGRYAGGAGGADLGRSCCSDGDASVCTSEWSSLSERRGPAPAVARGRAPRPVPKTDAPSTATNYAALMDRFKRVRGRY